MTIAGFRGSRQLWRFAFPKEILFALGSAPSPGQMSLRSFNESLKSMEKSLRHAGACAFTQNLVFRIQRRLLAVECEAAEYRPRGVYATDLKRAVNKVLTSKDELLSVHHQRFQET